MCYTRVYEISTKRLVGGILLKGLLFINEFDFTSFLRITCSVNGAVIFFVHFHEILYYVQYYQFRFLYFQLKFLN